jgi:glucose-6-phosphate 1-dehydrogenase
VAKIPSGVGPKFPQVVVLFGATGDLARRKLLPGLFHLATAGFIPGCRIVGVSLDEIDAEGFRKFARSSLDAHSARKFTEAEWAAFAQSLEYVPLSAGAQALAAAVDRAERAFGSECRRLHYVSVPPGAALSAVRMLGEARLVERSRIIMEKPFGVDLESAVLLNSKLHEVFAEDQIFRIDHFLGKEPAQNILAFRFANGLFEPIWNRNFIDHVQIDVPEKIGLETRAAFYEPTGAFRDMVVTHLFQILAFVAMEAPTSLEPAPISEEKNKVFRSMLPIAPSDVVRGQYTGYRSEPGVSPVSDTETFIALRCSIDNWRWAGVPFFLRTGKRLPERRTQIVIQFKPVPHSIFGDSAKDDLVANRLVIDLQPDEDIELLLMNKAPGISRGGMRLQSLPLSLSLLRAYEGPGSRRRIAYERLLLDVIHGNSTLFVRRDEVEEAWRWVDGVAEAWAQAGMAPKPYAAGSWGPAGAFALIERSERAWLD